MISDFMKTKTITRKKVFRSMAAAGAIAALANCAPLNSNAYEGMFESMHLNFTVTEKPKTPNKKNTDQIPTEIAGEKAYMKYTKDEEERKAHQKK